MAAQSKNELLEVTQKEFAKLEGLIGNFSAKHALVKDSDHTSVKDVIAHRAHWIELFLGWYSDGLAGKTVFFPAKGYKWNDLKRYNAELREAQSSLSWTEAQVSLRQNYEQLVAFIEKKSNDELYGSAMKGANNNWTAGRWAEAAGPSHFRSAAKYVRATLKNLS